MKTTTRIATTLAAGVLLATAGPSATFAASTDSTGQCPSGSFCIWGGTNYSGAFADTASTSATSTGVATAKSVWNRSTRAARVYSGSGGTGTSTCYAPGSQIASTTAAAVSFRILSTTTC